MLDMAQCSGIDVSIAPGFHPSGFVLIYGFRHVHLEFCDGAAGLGRTLTLSGAPDN